MHDMTKQEIFGHAVCRTHCDDESVYKNPEILSSIEMVFDSYVVKNRVRQVIGDSHKGRGVTSVGQPYPLVYLPGAEKMVNWLNEQFLRAKPLLGIDKPGEQILYKRSWANRMARGAFGDVHQHVKIDNYIALTGYESEDFCPDAVGILYIDTPPGSSNLVFVENAEGITDQPVEYFQGREDMFWLNPRAGDLVIHSPAVWHGVSKHNSDLHRNVFVFDIDYVTA
jgi:hypothetical protein